MKTLWNIFSFLAVVHLLALTMVIVWLWQSQRLTADRMHALRDMFAMTEPEAQAAAATAAAEAQTEHQKELDAQAKANPPGDSQSEIQHVSVIKQQEEQALRRLEDEKKMMLDQLTASSTQLERQRDDLDRQRVEWENTIRTDRQRKVDEQFLQTVKQYEQLTPKQGKQMIVALVNQKQTDQAVAYLDAMSPRAASRILKEFKTESEIALATELLEKLRTFGVQSAHPAVSTARPAPATTQAAPDAQRSSSHATGPSNACSASREPAIAGA
jgi:hypothetical protein